MTNNDIDYSKAYELKKNYPKEVRDQIKLYTIDKKSEDKTHLIGSYSYKSSNASDVDLLEEIRRKNPNDIIRFFSKNLKDVVNNLRLNKNQFFLELKSGLNHLYYDIKKGDCKNDIYNIPQCLNSTINKYYKLGFFNDDEYELLNYISKKEIGDQLDYELIHNTMRKRYILRWNAFEIMRGYKKLVDKNNKGYKYTIEDSIVEKSSINIEGIYLSTSNKYVECSNFIWLEYIDRQGKTMMINMPDLYLQYRDEYFAEDLKKSIYSLMYSVTSNFNPFKAIKRMFSYARHFELINLLEVTYKIINSQYGKLYNINTQIKTISKIIEIENKEPVNIDAIFNQIDDIRWNIQNVILDNFDSEKIALIIETLLEPNKMLNKNRIFSVLTLISLIIAEYMNEYTMYLLEDVKLYPLPNFLMPFNRPF